MKIRTFYDGGQHLYDAIASAEKEANEFLATLDKDQIVFVHPQSLVSTDDIAWFYHVITVSYHDKEDWTK